MQVKLSQAVKMFFTNSSLEWIYFEAIANALDAHADEIRITITTKSLSQPETLRIEISDNGEGFTKERFEKFSKLFDTEESSHKGLGRLVYLCYFNEVIVKSNFDRVKLREFEFNENFDEKNSKIIDVEDQKSGTVIIMSKYTLQRIAKNEYINAEYLKQRILQEFYSRLFQLKELGKRVSIKIKTDIEKQKKEVELLNSDIPEFITVELDSSINLIDKFYLYYSIKQVEIADSSLIAAVSVDNRTIKVEIVAEENIPLGYEMVFLLFSDYFNGKVDAVRQNLAISKTELKDIQTIFRSKVVEIIEENVPKIKKRNRDTKNSLINKYPHLSGYFDVSNVGYIGRNEILKKAQDDFFKAQKELLEANSLTEDQFVKALEVSSRALTEYILFRQLTIENLKKSTKNESEAEIHKLFATTRKHGKFEKSNFINDLYRNNSWLLDDKYMTYETVLSDREFSDLVSFITDGEVERNDDRIDIALVFSNNPNDNQPFDVVIVELKKRGISLEENMKVVTQLEKRARKLMHFYNNKIQRVWYYGIIEFNKEVELQLKGEYKELYSSGKMYYRETRVAVEKDEDVILLPIGVFIWDLDAVVNDAHSRNAAFLNLIKSKFTEND